MSEAHDHGAGDKASGAGRYSPECGPDAVPADPATDTPAGIGKPIGKRCQAITRSGTACTAWARKDGDFCNFHANPDKVSEFGRRGGEAKGDPGVAAKYAERPLKTVEDVSALLGDAIRDLGAGEIDPKSATALGYLAAGLLKALQQGDTEGRLRAVEAVLASQRNARRKK